MCLSIPVKIVSIDGDIAEVSAGGTLFKAGMQMIDNANVGDYVLLHAGFAIQKISEEDAAETYKILREMNDIG
ncbi:MAG: HypC/HybG/HupF family hydrogenase formation chaperone [Bacteroidia bacterium]|nr:HypC/HybG/HupF family hydrogenase formation chaperone [Bacteroidia bacterium]